MSSFWVNGIVSSRDHQPYIQLSNEKGMIAQLSMAQARAIAMDICRGNGHDVVAYIGDITSAMTDGEEGIAGFGMNLAEALRDLADEIEKEVTPRVRGVFE